MKKNAQSLLAIVILSMAAIGTTNAQIGFHAGYVNSTFATQAGDSEMSHGEAYNGFEAGLNSTNKIIGNVLAIKYGLNYTYLTANESTTGTFQDVNLSATEQTVNHYLDIPVHLELGIPLGFIRIFAYGGPKFVMGLASKTTFNFNGSIPIPGMEDLKGDLTYNNYNGRFTSNQLSNDQTDALNEQMDHDGMLKRFDILLGAGVGVELFNILTVKAGFDWGMLNLAKMDNMTINRNQLNVTVGVSF